MSKLLASDDILERYRMARRRSRALFALLADEAFDCRPIPLRHPIRFYEGHLAAFNANTLWEAGLLENRPEPALGELFARGIDPDSVSEARGAAVAEWPAREAVAAYVSVVDARMEEAAAAGEGAERLLTAVEHEEMHQETLLYLIHRLPPSVKRAPADARADVRDLPGVKSWIAVPGGNVLLGAEPGEYPFGWDNEFPAQAVNVPAFSMQSHKITNAEFLAFVEAGGYENPDWWSPEARQVVAAHGLGHPPFWCRNGDAWWHRGLFEDRPLPMAWPVLVSFHEAEAYARWQGARLPTEAEYHRAAYPEREAQGGRGGMPEVGNADFRGWELAPVGRNDAPMNRWGLVEMVGNGWEWTATPFAGFSGFKPMAHYPGYSADFFDGRHYVCKGASPATVLPLTRPSFRNWFRDHYPYAYTTFRLVEKA